MFNLKPISVHFWLACVTLIAGANYVFVKTIVPSVITPNAVVLIRIATAALVFYIAEKTLYPTANQPDRKDYIKLFFCAITGCVINQFFFYQGMKITTPINGSIMNLINPITIIIGSYFFLNDKMHKLSVFGFILAITGAVLLLDFTHFKVSDSTFWGDIFMMLNAISFGIYVVLVSTITQKYKAITIAKWMFIFAFIMFLPVGYSDLIATNFQVFTFKNWAALAYIVFLTTLFVYFMNNYLPSITSPYIIGIYTYLQPFVATVVALFLGADSLTFTKFGCGILIISGIYIAQLGRQKGIKENGN